MKYLKGSLKVEIKGCITENVYDFYNFIFNTGIKRFHIIKQKIKIYNDKCDTYVAIKFINITLDDLSAFTCFIESAIKSKIGGDISYSIESDIDEFKTDRVLLSYCYDSEDCEKDTQTEQTTPESVYCNIVTEIAKELFDNEYPKHYTVYDNYKYSVPIKYNLQENWFEINIVYFKCILDQHFPGEKIYPRTISKNIKNTLHPIAVKRKFITLTNKDLIKLWKSEKPKVNVYRFQFSDFINTDMFNAATNKSDDLF